MKATVENWDAIWNDMAESGIERSEYDEAGAVTLIVTKSGGYYDVSKELMLELRDRGMIEMSRGTKVDPESPPPVITVHSANSSARLKMEARTLFDALGAGKTGWKAEAMRRKGKIQ